ncbi:MAG: ASCH domain-containing protein [Pyrinomonadaceae bacterium]
MKAQTVGQFWLSFLEANPNVSPSTLYQVWYFGNSSAMAKELADLVLSGKKTATASLKTVNDLEPEKAPIDNGYSVVTSYQGDPLCVVRTTEIRHVPFNEVDAKFAYDEGEGDQTLDHWREGHWAYFSNEAPQYRLEFDETSLICCERFEVVYPTAVSV